MIFPYLTDRPDPANVYALDMGALPMVRSMMKAGIMIDRKALLSLGKTIDQDMAEISKRIYNLAGKRFLISSDEQVAALLFNKKSDGGLGLDSTYVKKTKKKRRPSTKKDELEKVAAQHPVVRDIIEWQHREHLKSCFVEKLPLSISKKTGRIHYDINTTRVATSRFAVADPPLQQIPVRTKLGRKIRDAFVVGDGRKMVACDYSQIEMRVAAHESRDPLMMEIFWSGDDIHWRTAEASLRRPMNRDDPADKEERASFKEVGFGVLYGLQAGGLRNKMISKGADPDYWTMEKCDGYISGWFSIYEGIRQWINLQHRRAMRYRLVWDFFGRTRHTPHVASSLPWIKAEAFRVAGNSPIQSGAMGISKLAMAVWAVQGYLEELRRKGKYAEAILQIHDELLIEVDEDIAEEVGEMVKQIMEAVITLAVPVVADYKVGHCWGELK